MRLEDKRRLRKLISKAELKEAIAFSEVLLEDTIFHQEVILLSSRLGKLKKDTIKAIITQENQTLEHNRISNDLLDLLTLVEDYISEKGVLEKAATSNQSALSSKAHESDYKVKYSTTLDLERSSTFFKNYYVNRKWVERSKAPAKNEDWRLTKTLPSGLFLGVDDTFLEGIYFLLTGKRFKHKEYDMRKFQDNPEAAKEEYPLLHIDRNVTNSLSWHPSKKLLVTAGIGSVTKLWDIETGALLNEAPFWHSLSSGNSLSWSDDGKLFAGDKYIFHGDIGEILIKGTDETNFIPGPGYSRYSGYNYDWLRGPMNYFPDGTSHLSSTNNFSPWRPNSQQCIMGDSGNSLIFRNRTTGKIEKIIDTDVHSPIMDFAWHPSGRFIAVAFKENNVRIIDIDNALVVDTVSASNILGWDPDGKILIARKERWKESYIAWDAIAMKEEPLPEGMEQAPWFKRFFLNISADDQRYFKVEEGQLNIYSVVSDELLTVLEPGGKINYASWSPIDGALLASCAGSETQIWKLH